MSMTFIFLFKNVLKDCSAKRHVGTLIMLFENKSVYTHTKPFVYEYLAKQKVEKPNG